MQLCIPYKVCGMMLLFRNSTFMKSLNAPDERLATSPYVVTRLHLPHAIIVRLHVRKSNIGNGGHRCCVSSILSLSEAMDVARYAPQGLTTCRRTLITRSLN